MEDAGSDWTFGQTVVYFGLATRIFVFIFLHLCTNIKLDFSD